jgi:hypothetical protein
MLGASGHVHPTHDPAGHLDVGGGGATVPSHSHPQTIAGRDAATEV